MRHHGRVLGFAAALLSTLSAASGLVTVAAPKPTEEKRPEGLRSIQKVTLANELVSYELTYDIIRTPGQTDEISSHWWAWQTGWTTLGMTHPSTSNFYFQGFFNWTFDDESLHTRPATMTVVRDGGQDGLVEFRWDTPRVTATLRFGLAAGSDQLLMFASYEPKQPLKKSQIKFSIYPTGFAQPRHRTVTTAARTVPAGERFDLDLATERWILFEDVTPDRPGDGSAGIVIGTPDAFESVVIPVGDYGIFPVFNLKPETRSFALGLYSFPTLPETETTRDYFRASGDEGATWLETVAAAGPAQPLPARTLDEARMGQLRAKVERLFERPTERWAPATEPLAAPWAAKLPGHPIETVVFTPRWSAWEVMELARRLDLAVEHLYFDQADAMSDSQSWPYARVTGVGTIGTGPMATKALDLLGQDNDLILIAGVRGEAVPQLVMGTLLQAVRAGAGLLLTGDAALLRTWPQELFATPAPELTATALDGLDWAAIPGYATADDSPAPAPLQGYRLGQGRVLTLTHKFGRYAPLVPRSSAVDGLEGGFDRALAVAARGALAAAGRNLPVALTPTLDGLVLSVLFAPAPPAGSSLRVRVQDDLDRTLQIADLPLPIQGGGLALDALPADRDIFLDLILTDPAGRTLGYAMLHRPAAAGSGLAELSIQPSTTVHEVAPPMVELPEGGMVTVAVQAPPGEAGRRVRWAIDDDVGRRLAAGESEVPAGGGRVQAELPLSRPVTISHTLSAQLLAGDRELAYQQRSFTVPLAYPYDDLTALLWTYTGADAVLRRTMQESYRQGTDMQDLSHVGGYSSEQAAREFALAAASGMRLIPYITRIAGEGDPEHVRHPQLNDPEYRGRLRESLARVALQARPYAPAAFTLGDENYLNRGVNEIGRGEHTVKAFGGWLREKYGTVAALNAAWGDDLASFEAIGPPPMREEAAAQSRFAQWLDKQLFLDTAFAETHRDFAEIIREQVPGAKVGWDGLLGYGWQSGYDFTKLTDGLELNQTYVHNWLQGELVRSFKQDGALTGEWGNVVAENEAAFRAWPWDSVLSGDNSVWWWTSWAVDYIPFDPDLRISSLGKGWFEGIADLKAGPGKLLLNAARDLSGIGILYSQKDVHVGALVEVMTDAVAPFIGDRGILLEHEALAHALQDLGYQYQFNSLAQLGAGEVDPARTPVLILNYAVALSDADVAALRAYVEAGGTLVANGRAGLLDGDGNLRDSRPLDGLFGVTSPAGKAALTQPGQAIEASFAGALSGCAETVPMALTDAALTLAEPGVRPAGGTPLGVVDQVPVGVVNTAGRGRAILLNVTLNGLIGERQKPGAQAHESLLAAAVQSAGVKPFAELTRADGERPILTQLVRFTDGDNRYLAVQQDLNQQQARDQAARITIPAPAVVYDLRAGKRVGEGRITSWELTISRIDPKVYALLPYAVTGVAAEVPATARPGESISVQARVQAEGATPGRHVVRFEVFAPNTNQPHREYSQNIDVAGRSGSGVIPFALNDPAGVWRWRARDVASGVETAGTLTLGG